MPIYQKVNGLIVPVEKKEPNKPVYLREFECPHCGYYYDRDVECGEEKTVGHAGPGQYIPHIDCPNCKKCMGCRE